MKLLSTTVASAFGLALLFAENAQASFLDSPSVAVYWGQNGKGNQKRLSSYCNHDSDVILVSFLPEFHDSSLPVLNLADSCNGPVFPGTTLLHCPQVGRDIKMCQKRGKKILLSLGGATGSYGFTSDTKAEAFADTLWDVFGGGKSKTRPFDSAIIDGFDLDIEGGGGNGYPAMVKRLRSHFEKDKNRKYYITAAPQCPFPDQMLGKVMNQVGMDAVFVQFYNNYCSANSRSFNFKTWDHWAKHTSPNRNVKVFLGLPGSKQAAGSGYVHYNKLRRVIQNTKERYSSFGGVMFWDASEVFGNKEVSPSYGKAIAKFVHALKGSSFAPISPGAGGDDSSDEEVCITEGQECSTNGQYTCTGNDYAICDHNKWSISSCPGGTVCFPTTDGESVYCGIGSNENTCSKPMTGLGLPSPQQPESPMTTDLTTFTHTYDIDGFSARLSVTSFSKGEFTAILNLRRIYDFSSNDANMVAEFQIADGIQIDSVVGGNVTQLDNRVRLEVPNAVTMSRIIKVTGRINSGIFVTPSQDSMLFN
ncbi:glycoside hydrolase superfamily [Choanephora cucurbitarum]|nr:glycoside hydrolase superfamily [Choanephora cucurbitarum]